MEPVWWNEREAPVSRAGATNLDLEDMAVAIVTREVRIYPRRSAETIDYRDAVAAPVTRPRETLRCDWQSDMEGQAWPRTVHS